jgi:ferritin
MLGARTQKLLIAQISSELGAHQTYMGMSLFFERESLKGWAKLFRDQAIEESVHATKITSYLIDNEVPFDLPAVTRAPTVYPSAIAACETALANEIKVTGQFNALAATAREEADHRTLQFLQWFIDEQVEEERTMRALIDLLASGINVFQAEPLLDSIIG